MLDALDPPHVQPHAGVELQRHPAGRRLRIAKHHADLLPQLVGEDHHRIRLRDRSRQLAQRLAHQPRLQAHVPIAHVAFDLRSRHQRRHRVHHHHVHRAGSHQRLGDLQRLLAGVRLRDVQIVDRHPDPLGVVRVQRMLHVHERTRPAQALRLGDHVQADRGLARASGP